MTSVWSVEHLRPHAPGWWLLNDGKHIGFFATATEAEAAMSASSRLPGFVDHPDGFRVTEVEIDAFDWEDGFSPAKDRRLVTAWEQDLDYTEAVGSVGPLAGELAWYGVRTVYRHDRGRLEERITVWQARDHDEAIALAEAEAHTYETVLGLTYLGFAQAHRSFLETDPIEPGMEIFSLLRESDLDDDDYLDRFFDSGREIGQSATDDAELPEIIAESTN